MTSGENNIDFTQVSSVELLEYMAMKAEFSQEAENAFTEFCPRFDQEIIRKAEIYCSKFGYGPGVALELAECTFARVWKYPTFRLSKSNKTNPDKAIIMWMLRILYTQLIKYGQQQYCADPTEEEDLAIISDIDELVISKVPDDDDFSRRNLKKALEVIERALTGLSQKHRVIYLTYKAYETHGKYLPRPLTKKLQDTLNLTQNSIQVYKKHAYDHVNNYLAAINGK